MKTPLNPACRMAMALGLAAALASPVAASDPRPFTFPQAEFMSDEQGMALAQDFVAQALPRGLPMNEAIARVERAVMSCHGGQARDGVVNCDFFVQARPPGGSLGLVYWNLSLRPGHDGALQSVSLHRSFTGMRGYVGTPVTGG